MTKRLRLHSMECAAFMLCVIGVGLAIPIHAQQKPKKAPMHSVSSSVPYGYNQVGDTKLYYYQSSNSIDVQGFFNDLYYGSTYNNYGYHVAMQVNEGTPEIVNCLEGSTIDGVSFVASIEPQGELARICYTVTNTTEQDVTVSLGTHADVMIGNNDLAPLSRRIDTNGSTYGVTMKDGNGAQLCVLFGSGLAGVTAVSDYWFGFFYLNSDPNSMVGNYTSGDNYMEEDGSYDSGMGWCWKNKPVAAGSTVVFSYLIGVGDVSLEPNSSFEVSPEDIEGWNDLSRPHKLTLEGTYESPAGLDGKVEYAVEDSEEWKPLTEMMSSGSTFKDTLVAMFDASRKKHVIRFRTVDAVGNSTQLTPIIYKDVYYHEVTGIEDKVYHYGDSIYQTGLTCDLSEGQYVVNEYHNNVNAGTATFMVQGVFPLTIGRRTYSFEISPLALEGGISLAEDNFVYTGLANLPEWQFTSELNSGLVEDVDYTVAYKNNLYPGEGSVEVTGKRNYTGTLTASFNIDKAQLSGDLYEFALPNNDISYDGEGHAATVSKVEGVGDVNITYVNTEDNSVSAEAPANVGSYDIYAEFADGMLYYGKANEKVGSFSIYHFDDDEWLALNALNTQLKECGWTTGWNIAAGPVAVGKFDGLVIEQGHVVGINFNNKNLDGIPAGILAFSQLKYVDLSHNNLTGNIGVMAAQIPGLTSLDVSYNRLSDVAPMISSNVTSLDISHQKIDRVVPLNLSELKMDDIATCVPSILLYDHENQTYSPNINLMCTTSETGNIGDDDWAMQLAVNNGNISLPYVSQNNAYRRESGDTLNVNDMNSGSSFKIKLNFHRGDANFVGGIDATDLQATILYAFGGYRNYPFNFTAADTYEDDDINVQDVVCTVNILLAQTAASGKAMRKAKSMPEFDDAEAFVYMRDGKVILYSEKPVAALSLKTSGNITWKLEGYGMTQTVANGNVVGYSLGGMTLPTGETVIGTCGECTNIHYATLADTEAQTISVALGENSPTGIHSVDGALDDDVQIFDINGHKVNRLNKGVNIKKNGGKTIKVINK